METEAKAKVVAAVLGGTAEFIQFLAALAILPRSIWKKMGGGEYGETFRIHPRLCLNTKWQRLNEVFSPDDIVR